MIAPDRRDEAAFDDFCCRLTEGDMAYDAKKGALREAWNAAIIHTLILEIESERSDD